MEDQTISDAKLGDAQFSMRRHLPDQPSLFPTEDLIVPDTLRTMRKAVSAIHATPLKEEHNHTLNSRRLFDGVIMVAQIDCRSRGDGLMERIRTERVSPLFEVRVSELAKIAGIPGKNYKRLYESLDRLFSMVLNWNAIGEDSTVEWSMKAHFLSSLGYGLGGKEGLIRFSFDPSILEICLEPSQWATLSLQTMHGLGTGSSYSLFQNTWRYLGTAAKVTAALPTATWIKLLVGESRYVKEENGNTIVNYGDFKRRILLDAIERVNEAPALSHKLVLKEHKSGNRVSRLQFKFVAKETQSLGLPLTWPADVVKVLESMGYLQRDIQELSEGYSFEVVADAIVRLKASEGRIRSQGKTITARKAYFEGILRNLHGGGKTDDADDDRIAEEVRRQEAKLAADARQARLKESFQAHQRECFVSWLYSLPEVMREELVEAFKNSAETTAPEKHVLAKGLRSSNTSATALLRTWLAKVRPELLEQAFSNPEDKSFDTWMAWRLERLEPSNKNE